MSTIKLSHDEVGLLLNWAMWKDDMLPLNEEDKRLKDKIFTLFAWTVKEDIKIEELEKKEADQH